MIRRGWAASITALSLACGGYGSEPGDSDNDGGGDGVVAEEIRLLSVNSPTRDEDPSVLRARDGQIYVAWFSDRGGNADIYITRTTDGTTWSSPARVTTSVDADYYPQLLQDDDGRFHLVWFRWQEPGKGHIWYNSSADGVTWSQATEQRITSGADVDDWVPTVERRADGALLVYFVSAKRVAPLSLTSDVFMVMRRPGATTWDAEVPMASLSALTSHDQLPVVKRTGGTMTMVWVRHDIRTPLPWLHPRTVMFFATSADGLEWSTPVLLTDDSGNVVNLFPTLYTRHDGSWHLLWLSTRAGQPAVFEVPVATLSTSLTGIVRDDHLPGSGYSHKIVATATPGRYFAAWVQGADGAQDIYYRFFRR